MTAGRRIYAASGRSAGKALPILRAAQAADGVVSGRRASGMVSQLAAP
jgi:hypothetical protein